MIVKLPDGKLKLGDVANIVLKNDANHTSSGGSISYGDQFLLIDLVGRPELTSSVRKVVISFLDPLNDGSGASRIQNIGTNAFTVRLNKVITNEARVSLSQQGEGLVLVFVFCLMYICIIYSYFIVGIVFFKTLLIEFFVH